MKSGDYVCARGIEGQVTREGKREKKGRKKKRCKGRKKLAMWEEIAVQVAAVSELVQCCIKRLMMHLGLLVKLIE